MPEEPYVMMDFGGGPKKYPFFRILYHMMTDQVDWEYFDRNLNWKMAAPGERERVKREYFTGHSKWPYIIGSADEKRKA
ncbi:MAG: hypothetical protein ACFWTZ_00430 [Burkholderia sp.]|jgi:hypothetical protein